MKDGFAPTAAQAADSVGETDSTVPNSTVPAAESTYPSSSSDYDIEKLRSATTDSADDVLDHVDVQYAEKQFEELKRRYSDLSRVASHASQRSRRKPTTEKAPDESNGAYVATDEEFDLEDMLRDRHRKEVEHDIKPKHLGMKLLYC